MKKAILSIVTFLLLFAVTSCKKSDSKRDDLIGHWQQESYPNNNLNFNSDGTGNQIDPAYGTFQFNWSFADNENSVVLYDGNTYVDTWKIRELNSGRFTFQDENGGYIYTFLR